MQCFLCANKTRVLNEREQCVEKMEKQAKKMLDRSAKRFKPAHIGDNVLVPIPDVDKGRVEFRNIKGIVTGDLGNGCFTIGTPEGTLKQPYTRNQFIPTTAELLKPTDVKENLVSLREVANKVSLCGGQGYDRCNCTTGCSSNRCSCKKAGKLCSSKCHHSLSCTNK